jgi:hypothetical protein
LVIPILCMGFFPSIFCAYLVIVQNTVRGFSKPFAEDYMHRRVDSDVRATALSVQSTLASFTSLLGLWAIGSYLKIYSLDVVLCILGGATLAFSVTLYTWYRLVIVRTYARV